VRSSYAQARWHARAVNGPAAHAGFHGVTALLLLVAGFFLARAFERDLDRSLDAAQRAQVQDIAALVETAPASAAVRSSGERYAQDYAADSELVG
jgi:hypothetical protein